MNKEKKEIEYTVTLIIPILFLFLFSYLYYSNYNFFEQLDITMSFLDDIFIRGNWGFFDSNFKIRALFIALTFIVLLYSKKERVGTIKSNLVGVGISIVSFIGLELFRFLGANIFTQALNILGTLILYIIIIRYMFKLSAWLNNSVSLSQNDIKADGFLQNEKVITNEYSINFDYTYVFKKQVHKGKINVINPFRATYILGTPGSGKSYAILEEYLRQWILRNYCAIVYDYKDPALSVYVYNCWLKSKECPNNNVSFKYISFRDIRKSCRCNPLKGICSTTDALEMSNTILVSLNKNYIERKGDFFVESSLKYTALNIMLLGTMFNGKYLSIPHLISIVGQKSGYIFDILNVFCVFNLEASKLFTAFKQAYDNKATEQLAGQLASAQIGLGSISDRVLAYVMTEGENEDYNISLDINNLNRPSILCLGNDPTKDTILGMANSVYLSRINKLINKKGVPCLYAVDELPTVYINGIDNLIATARSNKIATLLAFQDFSQLKRDYGDKVANVIINTVGNTFVGAVQGETAKRISESFGEKKVNKISKSQNDDGAITVSTQEQKEKKITEDTIISLSQGQFCGRVADEFDTPTDNKVFLGTIQIDPKVKQANEEIPNILDISDEDLNILLSKNIFDIDNDVSKVLSSLQKVVIEFRQLSILTNIADRNDFQKQNPDLIIGCLQEVVNSDFSLTSTQEVLLLWIEQALWVIDAYVTLDIKNDYFDNSQKMELLLRNLWIGDEIEVMKILSFIKINNLSSLENLKAYTLHLEEREQSKSKIKFDGV